MIKEKNHRNTVCRILFSASPARMSTFPHEVLLQLQLLPLLFMLAGLTHICSGDVGTSGQYSPPYLPTACYGNDASEFPSSNLFAAAGEGVWDNGAACGRQYLVRCISAVVPRTCIAGQTIQIKIVDRAATALSPPSRSGATLVLSNTAFATVANASASSINIEFQQV